MRSALILVLLFIGCGQPVFDWNRIDTGYMFSEKLDAAISSVAISDVSNLLAATTVSGKIYTKKLPDEPSDKLATSVSAPLIDVFFQFEQPKIIFGGISGMIIYQSVSQDHPQKSMGISGKSVTCLEAIKSDPRYFIAGEISGSIRAWDSKSGWEVWNKQYHQAPIIDIESYNLGKNLLTLDETGLLNDWDVSSINVTRSFETTAISLAVSNDEKWAALNLRNSISVYTLPEMTESAGLKVQRDDIRAIAFVPGYDILITVGNRISVWDYLQNFEIRQYQPPGKEKMSCLAISANRRYLAVGGDDGTLWVYELY